MECGVVVDRTSNQQPILDIQFACELRSVDDGGDRQGASGDVWPVWANLTNGVVVGCDFVVSATGVRPNTDALGPEFKVRRRDIDRAAREAIRAVRQSSAEIFFVVLCALTDGSVCWHVLAIGSAILLISHRSTRLVQLPSRLL